MTVTLARRLDFNKIPVSDIAGMTVIESIQRAFTGHDTVVDPGRPPPGNDTATFEPFVYSRYWGGLSRNTFSDRQVWMVSA